MTKIISDTACMYSEKNDKDITVIPLTVTIDQKQYRELSEINSHEFIEIINQGHLPTSSQPSIGEVLEVYQQQPDVEILNLTIADGLSGTYQSAVMAREQIAHKENIHVVNSRTLCGPLRYLVDKAKSLADEGKSSKEILEILTPSIDNSYSFLLPQDFSYLKRGGRLTPLAATLGGILKISPILTLSEDATRLEKYGMKRTFKSSVTECLNYFKERINDNYLITIAHGCVPEQAKMIEAMIQEQFPNNECLTYELTPAFITQGGPGCVAIQCILK